MTSSNTKHLRLPVSLHTNMPVQTYALVDSGASGNYISRQLYDTLGTGRRRKQQPYQLVIANGQTELVCHKTQPMEIVTRHHAERIHLDIVKLATQDIYLGMPWLKKHNPVVNWKTGVLTFRNCMLRPRLEQLSRPKRVYRGTRNNVHPTRWTRWTMCNQLVQLVHGNNVHPTRWTRWTMCNQLVQLVHAES